MEFPDDPFRGENEVIEPTFFIPFKYYLMIYVLINFGLCLLCEKLISRNIIRKWLINRMKIKQVKIQKEEIEPNLNLLNEIKNYTKAMKIIE